MKKRTHMKVAGILQMMQSFILFEFSGLFVIRVWTDYRTDSAELDEYIGWISILVFTLTLVTGASLLWFGLALLRQKSWTTRIWGILCCAPGLFVFPMVFSAYTLWVLIWVRRQAQPVIEL